jgi:hypothetical protein
LNTKRKKILILFDKINIKTLDKWSALFKLLNQNLINYETIQLKNIYNKFDIKITSFILFKFLKELIFLKKWKSFTENDLYYLKNHPFYQIGIKKLFPINLKILYLNYTIYKLNYFLDKNDYTNIFVMEPKNFLYSLNLVIIENISSKLKIDFEMIHYAFDLKNLKIFNSLKRSDENLVNIFNSIYNRTIDLNIEDKFNFLPNEKYEININKKKNDIDQFSINFDDLRKSKKKIAIISLNKEKNFREFYFYEDTFPLNEVIIFLKSINYNIILRPHPLSDVNYNSKFKDVIVSRDSVLNIRKKIYVDLHISSASHSFFDAILSGIPIFIFSKKNLYETKNMFNEIYCRNIFEFKNNISKLKTYDFQYRYKCLIKSLSIILHNKKSNLINFDNFIDLDNANYFNNVILDKLKS